ncbi:Coenzyme F420-reducing hydrogenase, alpha subunit [Halapricum desulfuricans]|uniref:Coenzyme F420-reducing hydrogenase, alpha subunit n=1 Tax=Halapricum desulfuricans TaxID=2841257 RepID=A0A897NDU3_9EURY|nr:Ni/Fe hydrogenase subunit alpha [Halapricum desulfuricans]QSG10584.1 Coenzyme F420-reducing hydrogenase, alpha subunit [Halapricum desulfuricans]
MSKKQVIDPVTRVEGHGKITIELDDDGEVEDTQFHVTEFRGFEEFVEGRPVWEMPEITARICGICPVSHQLAAAKAVDEIAGVEIPEGAKKLRELLHMGQVLQSHALSFFYLSSPDLVLGYDADPEKRNIEGVLEENPQLAERGIDLRKFGQDVIAALGDKKVHPDFAIGGGVTNTLDPEDGEQLREQSEDLDTYVRETIDLLQEIFAEMDDDTLDYATYETGYMGLVNEDGGLEHYDGDIRLVDEEGDLLEGIDDSAYADIIGERSKEWSYLKFPYYKERGFEDGQYRVGPLGRLNAVDQLSTPQAQAEFERYMDAADGAVHERSTYYHWARLIEILYCIERIRELLENDAVYEGVPNVPTKPENNNGVGVIEAPRGTLIHEYDVDDDGKVTNADFIVATTHNNGAMNKGVRTAAETFVDGPEIPEGTLNKMESVIRCYDPCLSCSTHAIGDMPLEVTIERDGEVLDEVSR